MANAVMTGRTSGSAVKTMDDELKQRAIEAQKLAHQTSDSGSFALARLVDEILRSRRICRPYKGQPLFGVYLDIYRQITAQLLEDTDEALDSYDPEKIETRVWASKLRDNAIAKVLDWRRLQQLAIEAQRHPPQAELRQYALRELVEAIQLSGKLFLSAYYRTLFSPQFSQLVYDDAVNQTLTYVCEKIDNFNPQRAQFMTWVNNIVLKNNFIKCSKDFNRSQEESLPSLEALERMAAAQEKKNFPQEEDRYTIIRHYIEEDADRIFEKEHIKNRPDATFKSIALATLDGKSWPEISRQLGIKVPTLSSFFRRCCKKFSLTIKEDLGI